MNTLSIEKKIIQAIGTDDRKQVEHLFLNPDPSQRAPIEIKCNHLTPLLLCSQLGRFEIMRFLVEQGAKITATDQLGWTALHHAARTKHHSMIKYLIEKKLNINAKSTVGITPLMCAANSDIETISLLLQHHADINAQDNNGETTLIYALMYQNEEIAKFLIEEGADITLQNKIGEDAFFWAVNNENENMIRYFVKNNYIRYNPNEANIYQTDMLKKKKNSTLEEIIAHPQINPQKLQDLIITENFLKILKKQPYTKQVEIYQITKNKITPQKRKEFEEIIRAERKRQRNN